jgi:hypothetical protein
MPHPPEIKACQKASLPIPIGETTPTPVTTTRLGRTDLFFLVDLREKFLKNASFKRPDPIFFSMVLTHTKPAGMYNAAYSGLIPSGFLPLSHLVPSGEERAQEGNDQIT